MGFFQNACKPEGLAGKVMLKRMNIRHARLAEWGFSHIMTEQNETVLDVGCGGGANLTVWLNRCPNGKVFGLDYSDVSVRNSRKLNDTAIAEKRCEVIHGSVAELPFKNDTFDYISAFETIYFWPNLEHCFWEIYRVLKENGQFLICNELDGTTPEDEKWETKIDGMTVYKAEELKKLLIEIGFTDVKIDQTENHWICLVAKKAL